MVVGSIDNIHSYLTLQSNLDLNIDKSDLYDLKWLRREDDDDDNDCCVLVATESMRHSMTFVEQGEESLRSCCNKLDLLACDDELQTPAHLKAFETSAVLAVRQTS